MNMSNTDIDPVDWTVFDKPLPPGTPVDPKEVEMKKAIAERIAENRLKEKKLKG